MTEDQMIAQLVADVYAAGIPPGRLAHALARVERERERRRSKNQADPEPAATCDAHGISTRVPPELWLGVLVGAIDEAEAIERGRLAVGSTSEEMRHRILFKTPCQGAVIHDHKDDC